MPGMIIKALCLKGSRQQSPLSLLTIKVHRDLIYFLFMMIPLYGTGG